MPADAQQGGWKRRPTYCRPLSPILTPRLPLLLYLLSVPKCPSPPLPPSLTSTLCCQITCQRRRRLEVAVDHPLADKGPVAALVKQNPTQKSA